MSDDMQQREDEAPDALAAKLAALEAANRRMGWMLAVGAAVVLTVAAAVVFGPQRSESTARLAALEAEVEEAQEEASLLRRMLPADMDARLADLSAQVTAAQEQAGAVAAAGQRFTEQVSAEVLAPDAGALEARMAALEARLAELRADEAVAGVLDYIGALEATQAGRAQLDALVAQLTRATDGAAAQGGGALDAALAQARAGSAAAGQAFAGLPDTELKAAAMLLAMTQVRSALARDGAAFDDDLALMRNLVGDGDPALTAAIDRLAPHAASGVLTPGGLLTEFRGLAGDAVAASLRGEDVALSERAAARFHKIVQVERDGVPVTGTPTQATVAQAERALAAGDVAGAVALVEALDGPGAEVLGPWLAQAQASLGTRRDARGLLDALLAAGGAPGGELIVDEASGLMFYKRATMPEVPWGAEPNGRLYR
jgi:hypothetical protein